MQDPTAGGDRAATTSQRGEEEAASGTEEGGSWSRPPAEEVQSPLVQGRASLRQPPGTRSPPSGHRRPRGAVHASHLSDEGRAGLAGRMADTR